MSGQGARVSIVVPTFHEVQNLPEILARIQEVRKLFQDFEVIIVDDDSQDGTEALLRDFAAEHPWLRYLIRKNVPRGLGVSALEGFRMSRFDFLVLMDSDLSHPPEVIPKMIDALQTANAEMALGSRYVPGGQVDEHWSWKRILSSKLAALLTARFSQAKDPLSGFIAMPRRIFERARDLDPRGFKLGLEIAVKSGAEKIVEVPIYFQDRKYGQSKMSWREEIEFLKQLKFLADFKFGRASYLRQYLKILLSI